MAEAKAVERQGGSRPFTSAKDTPCLTVHLALGKRLIPLFHLLLLYLAPGCERNHLHVISQFPGGHLTLG